MPITWKTSCKFKRQVPEGILPLFQKVLYLTPYSVLYIKAPADDPFTPASQWISVLKHPFAPAAEPQFWILERKFQPLSPQACL